MSVEDAKKFVDELENDPAARKKVRTSLDGIVKAGTAAGHQFTLAELHQHLRKRWGITKPVKGLSQTDDCTVSLA